MKVKLILFAIFCGFVVNNILAATQNDMFFLQSGKSSSQTQASSAENNSNPNQTNDEKDNSKLKMALIIGGSLALAGGITAALLSIGHKGGDGGGITEDLSLQPDTANQHLQYRSVSVVNTFPNPVTLTSINVTTHNNEIVICPTSGPSCQFHSTCNLISPIPSGSSCTIWLHTVDNTPLAERYNDTLTVQAGAGIVRSINITYSKDLYAAGTFFSPSNGQIVNIAKWNGSSWQSLGNGLGDQNGYISSLAIDVNGDLLAAGEFNKTGGSSISNNVARWNGTTWQPAGSGLSGPSGSYILSLLVDQNNNVIAGGGFNNISGSPNIAKWDGTTWYAMGSGLGSYGTNYVSAMVLEPSSHIIAAGDFTSPSMNIAKWDGSSWKAFSPPLTFTEIKAVRSLAYNSSTGTLYAGGIIQEAPDKYNVVQYNSTISPNWQGVGYGLGYRGPYSPPLPQTIGYEVITLVIDPSSGDLIAGGEFNKEGDQTLGLPVSNNIAKWTGGPHWQSFDTGLGIADAVDGVYSVVFDNYDGTLFAGGWFNSVFNSIAKWTGTGWGSFAHNDFQNISDYGTRTGRIRVIKLIPSIESIG